MRLVRGGALGVVLTMLAAAVFIAAPVLVLPAAAARPVTPVVRSLALDRDLLASRRGATVATQSRSRATPAGGRGDPFDLQSRLRGTERFSLLAVTWRRPVPGTEYHVEARTRSGGRWRPWSELHPDDHGSDSGAAEDGGPQEATAPLWVGPSDGVQVRVRVLRGAPPRHLSAVLVDPGHSAADAATGRTPLATAAAHIPQPPIYRRKHWGADESLRRSPPQYSKTIKAAFVHHTAGNNSYSKADVPKIIRAIYAYHVKTRGWSDLGYNFLIDRFGRIWEGRHGGIARAVLGAHTGGFNTDTFGVAALGHFENGRPSEATVRAIANVIAWKFALYGSGYGLDARGRVTLRSAGGGTTRFPAGKQVRLYRISGHRDVGKTACPGELLYPKLPRIRQLAAERMRRESNHRTSASA